MMTENDYIYRINSYNNQLSDYQEKLNSIKRQIDEAEEAFRNARAYSDKFYDAVDHKKNKGQTLAVGNGLRAVLGWAKQINEMLTGREFQNADQNVQDMINSIKEELKRLYSDYNYYEDQIASTRNQINNTQTELNTFRRNQAAEAERRARETREAEARRVAAEQQAQAQARAAQQSKPAPKPGFR